MNEAIITTNTVKFKVSVDSLDFSRVGWLGYVTYTEDAGPKRVWVPTHRVTDVRYATSWPQA